MKTRITFLLTLSMLLLCSTLWAQNYASLSDEDFAEYPHWIEMMQDQDVNFYDVQRAFELYWNDRKITKGCGWKPFKRWEYMMSSRVDADGNRPEADQEWNAYFDYLKKFPEQKSANGNWTNLGPFNIPADKGYKGLGRINALAFHPSDPQTIFIGAPSGGLWISHDQGGTWVTTTDGLPSLGVSAILVDQVNPDIIYIGSGDRDAGDAPGIGIVKSFDGGQTWDIYNNGMGNATVGRLIADPDDSEIIYAATSSGIYKSYDGGENWTILKSGNFKDIVFKADDATILYATANGAFYRSENSGAGWQSISNGIPAGSRGVIGVSIANPNVVYFVQAQGSVYGGTYRSKDAGESFTEMSTTPNIMSWGCQGGEGGQAWYDLDVAVDPDNANIIYVGGVNCFKSEDGGVSWEISSHWWGDCGVPAVHADLHVLEYNPADGRLYAGNDGGIYWTNNGGTNWTLISNGLAIGQVYKIGQSATQKDKVINGYQDNGTSTFMGDDEWYFNLGGDGMECAVDHEDASYSYGTLYYGDVFRVLNNNNLGRIAGDGYSNINESGGWITPFLLHESNANTMFVGYKNIWRGTDIRSGNPSWTKISNLLGGSNNSNMRVLEHSPADINILYAARDDKKLFRTDNANTLNPSWTNLTSGLPDNSSINDLEAHPVDPNILYMCLGEGVYKSTNKGVSWEDITGSLPEVSKNDIAYYKNSQEGLYVGTDIGIFYRDAFLDDWIMFGDGFPASARVTELEIYYEANNPTQDVIRAATYGRGLWSSDMYHSAPTADFTSDMTTVPPSCPVTFTDQSQGVPTTWSWSFPGGNPSSSSAQNPSEILYETPGTYDVTLLIENEFGTDTKFMEGLIVVDDQLVPDVDFTSSSQAICDGEVVYFMDQTQFCPTSWEWSFEPDDIEFVEGTTAQSQHPAVLFPSTNNYTVTLTSANGVGSASIQKESFILSGGYPLPFLSDFDNGFDAQNWLIVNEDSNISWDIFEPNWSPNGNKAAYLNFFNYTDFFKRDDLISPAINLSGIDQPHLYFNHAYTYKFAQYDSLIIKISTDCGENWERIYANGSNGTGSFETAEPRNEFFNPSSAEDWCGNGYGADCIAISLAEYSDLQNIKLLFQSMNRFGNNLFISDIQIASPTAIPGSVKNQGKITIHPNPGNGIFNISTQMDGVFDMEIYNAQNQLIKSGKLSGETRINLSKQSKGIYFIRLSNRNYLSIEKVIIK